MKFLIGGLALSVFLIGCSDTPDTIKYYETHPEKAEIRVNKCKDEGKLSDNQERDCFNASSGLQKAYWNGYKSKK